MTHPNVPTALRSFPVLPSTLSVVLLLLALCGCSVNVASDLAEIEANRVMVTLNEHGIAATKAPDPAKEGRFTVRIPEGDLSAAVAALQNEGLPGARSPGVLGALGEPGLVTSRSSEHARLMIGTAGELERSLTEVTGVLSARVHLAVPERDALAAPDSIQSASASVLIRHQGASPPLGAQDVQRLVAGAVPGLNSERVAVVHLTVPGASAPPSEPLMQFGPVSVSRSSVGALRWLVGGVAALNVTLLAALILFWLKLRERASEADPRG